MAVVEFAGKVYGYLKGLYDFFSDSEADVATLIENAKTEIIERMEELDHLLIIDQVGAYIHDFKDFAFYAPVHADLVDFIQAGSFIIERLETTMIEKEVAVGRAEAYRYTFDGKYAYHDAVAYNLVVLLRAAAMKMDDWDRKSLCELYRRAFAVNLELIGEPTSQPLPFGAIGYTSPAGVRCYSVSRLWEALYSHEVEKWEAGSLDIVCVPIYSAYLTSHSKIPSVYAKSVSSGRYGLEGAAADADQKKCLDVFTTRFFNDPVVAHIEYSNKRLLALLGDCDISVLDVATALQKHAPLSVRNDIYGPESTQRALREMCEIAISRSPNP